jgi:hypothetical protein
MLMLSLVRILHNLAVWALARTLNIPEPLVHETGVFVFVRVQSFESRVGRALCPRQLWRQLRSWFR